MEFASQKPGPNRRNRPKVPKSLRKRIERACTRCRARKRKCRFSDQLDVCENCQRAGHSCVVEPAANPELLAPFLDPALKDIEHRFRLQHPDTSLRPEHWETLARLFRHRVEADDDFSDKISFPVRKVHTPQGQSDSLGFRDFLTSASSTLSQDQSLDLLDGRMGYGFPLDYAFLYNATKEQYLFDILSGLPTQAEADFIISTFFLYASLNWYCLDGTSFQDRVTSLYEHNLDASCIDCDFLYLFLTVLALGSQFIELRQVPKPRDLAIASNPAIDAPGVHFIRSAVKLLAMVLSIPSIESCQGLFLTGLYYLPVSQSSTSYTYIALSMRVAIGLGLHQGDTNPSLDEAQVEYQHRIFWTLYSIERRLAIAIGYPETIQEREIKCPLPKSCRDLDGNNHLQVERLTAYVNLTLIMNRLIQRDQGSWSTYLEEARTAIRSWWEDIPIQMRSLDNALLRANAHLHIYYHQVWIYAGRKCLIHLVRERLRNRFSPMDEAPEHPAVEALTEHCIESANETINFLGLLRAHKQLSHFSYTDFHSCVCATIVLLLGSILRPCAAIMHQVQAAMDTSRFMSAGNENAKEGVRLVESFLDIVNSSLSSLCARQSPGRPLDDGIDEVDAEQTQQHHDRPGFSSIQPHCTIPLPTHATEPASDRSLFTVLGDTDAAPQTRSSDGPYVALYDRLRTAATECSSQELRLLGITDLFDEDNVQVPGNLN